MRNALREIPKLNSHFPLQLENYAFENKSGLYKLNLENIKIGFANKINLPGYLYLCRCKF